MATQTKRAKREASDDSLPSVGSDTMMEAANTSSIGESSGGSSGSAGGGDPIPMAMPQHQRAIDHFVLKAAGTTFVGPGITATQSNDWYRFPWEIMKPFVNDWTAIEIEQKWLYYKVKNVSIEFKNPLCIQEIGSTTSALATAGQNLHANLYAYCDNMYIRGVQQPFARTTTANINPLISSWRNHGYNAGAPVKLPVYSLDDRGGIFQNNFPDVKQCGMGPGKSINFSWNVNNKYWRSTDNFSVVNQTSSATDTNMGFIRWDQRFGAISQLLTGTGNLTTHQASRVGAPQTSAVDRSEWYGQVFLNTQTNANGVNVLYLDPDPMPGIYLQLQPQLGAISSGISDSICQLQFELKVEIECTGRLPRMALDSTTNTIPNADNKFDGRSIELARTIPLFYDSVIIGVDDGNV